MNVERLNRNVDGFVCFTIRNTIFDTSFDIDVPLSQPYIGKWVGYWFTGIAIIYWCDSFSAIIFNFKYYWITNEFKFNLSFFSTKYFFLMNARPRRVHSFFRSLKSWQAIKWLNIEFNLSFFFAKYFF